MSTEPFFHQYRPLRVADFAQHQETIGPALDAMLRSDQLCLVLAGDVGVGKTALLQAIVRDYYRDYYHHQERPQVGLRQSTNNAAASDASDASDPTPALPPAKVASHVLHIHALQEQSLSFYRQELRQFCQARSSIPRRKKVVVLDDLDRVHGQCQQVLRSCIDRYQHQVHFVAACTNPHHLIESLRSRLFLLRLDPPSDAVLRALGQRVCAQEGIACAESALDWLVVASRRRPKVLLALLEKVWLLTRGQKGGALTLDEALPLTTDIPLATWDAWLGQVLRGEHHEAAACLFALYDQGHSVMDLLHQCLGYLRLCPAPPGGVVLQGMTDGQRYVAVRVVCHYMSIFHNVHEHEVELALFAHELARALRDA